MTPEPYDRWLGPDNVYPIKIDGNACQALLDTGSQINIITPEFAKTLNLEIRPLKELVGRNIPIRGVGGVITNPDGYTVIEVSLDGLTSYKEWQVALVLKDDSDFATRVPVILGTCCLNRAFEALKETELATLPVELEVARRTYVHRRQLQEGILARVSGAAQDPPTPPQTADSDLELDELVRLTQDVEIGPAETRVIHPCAKKGLNGRKTQVMITGAGDVKSYPLPRGLVVINTYAEVDSWPKGGKVPLVLRNLGATARRLKKGTVVGRVTIATSLTPSQVEADLPHLLLEMGDTPPQPSSETTEETEGIPPLTPTERQALLLEKMDLTPLEGWSGLGRTKRLLGEFHDVFSLDPGEIGRAQGVEHHIRLKEGQEDPFQDRFRRIPAPLMQEVRKNLDEMIAAGAIRPSKSPWCSAVVLVRKKDGSLRFCIDYRRLNAKTKRDSYPLPRITEAVEGLKGACFFSTLDLKCGFWQSSVAEQSKAYTAFTVGNMGFFEWERMPFGLTNAPATFQRMMEDCLGELNTVCCLIYLDDIIVFSSTRDEHLDRLRIIFERLREHGLLLKPSKCTLFQEEINYLGHRVSKEGALPSKQNMEAVAAMSHPTTYTEIRRFLGLAGHYRRFIKDYAKTAGPLHQLLSGENSDLKNVKVTLPPEAREAVDQLKLAMINPPVLAFADFEKPFLVETDASKVALGAVLSQKQPNGRFQPVAYASHRLNTAEQNYHSTKQEFLALKWAITEQFREYLLWKPFEVRTDNNPLTYIATTPNLDATGHRWVSALAAYDFSITYQKGRDNTVADALSRIDADPTSDEALELLEKAETPGIVPQTPLELPPCAVKSLLEGAVVGCAKRAEVSGPAFQQAYTDLQAPMNLAARLRVDVQVPDWAEAQRLDPPLLAVHRWLDLGDGLRKSLQILLDGDTDSQEGKALLRDQKRLVRKNGLLYRKYTAPGEREQVLQFITPKAYRNKALNGCHQEAGHQGQIRTNSLLKDRFWWPGMTKDVKTTMEACGRCIRQRNAAQTAPLRPILVNGPFELLHVDFTSVEVTQQQNIQPRTVNVLVFTDHFTRHTSAFVTPDQTAKTAAKFLWECIITTYGAPAQIISDQGRAFTSNLLRELCELLGIRKIQTTAYHPQSNGQCERMNQTLIKMIGKLGPDMRGDWPMHLHELTHAYNCTRSAITGYSPYYLMFGRRPRIPVDFYFPTLPMQTKTKRLDTYVKELRERLIESFQVAEQCSVAEAQRQKAHYDQKCNARTLEKGDLVLTRIDAVTGKRKTQDRWSREPSEVVGPVAPGVPAYVVKDPLTGIKKTIHRNRLFPLPRGVPLAAPTRATTESDTPDSAGTRESISTRSNPAETAKGDAKGYGSGAVAIPSEMNCGRPACQAAEWMSSPAIQSFTRGVISVKNLLDGSNGHE